MFILQLCCCVQFCNEICPLRKAEIQRREGQTKKEGGSRKEEVGRRRREEEKQVSPHKFQEIGLSLPSPWTGVHGSPGSFTGWVHCALLQCPALRSKPGSKGRQKQTNEQTNNNSKTSYHHIGCSKSLISLSLHKSLPIMCFSLTLVFCFVFIFYSETLIVIIQQRRQPVGAFSGLAGARNLLLYFECLVLNPYQ